jgi:plastocyanin
VEHLDQFLEGLRSRILISLILLSAVFPAGGAEIEVTVLDREGQPVPNVAVYVQSANGASLPAPTNHAVMDQIDTRFVPHLLVVQSGTSVDFSNSDIIAHHVYSFSKPNNFMLPLYKGDLQPQITFKHEGVVTLGCNIHDHMLAYILVVDSQALGKTSFDGKINLTTDNPDGLTVSIWSPRFRHGRENLAQSINAGKSAAVTFSLTEKLRPPHSNDSDALTWNEY